MCPSRCRDATRSLNVVLCSHRIVALLVAFGLADGLPYVRLDFDDVVCDGFYECWGDFPEVVDKGQFPTLASLHHVQLFEGDLREAGGLCTRWDGDNGTLCAKTTWGGTLHVSTSHQGVVNYHPSSPHAC
jgi:hypothetical protein